MMAIRHFMSYVCYSTYECILLFSISLVMIFTVDWKIALAMLAVLPFTLINTIIQSKNVKPKFGKVRERFSSLNAFAQENISGNRVVKAFAKEDYEISKFDTENTEYRAQLLEKETGAPIVIAISITLQIFCAIVSERNAPFQNNRQPHHHVILLPLQASHLLLHKLQRFLSPFL